MAYTTIDDPSAHFHTQVWTGNSGYTVNVINDAHSGDFRPDLIWAKDRVNAYNHDLVDSSRGPTVAFHPNTDAAEYTRTQSNYDFTSFNSNGFTTGAPDFTNSFGGNNQTNGKVAWQWKANGGTTSSNTDGDITSTVQVNSDAGFSIVTYTGNTSNNQTVGHGLGAVPGVILIRNRSRAETWRWNQSAVNNGTGMIQLNNTVAYNTTGTTLMNVAATSSVFSVSTDWSVNGNYPFVAWCWAEKQGYSKFDKYVGNGIANGQFVYTGFKPAFLLVKKSSDTGNWLLYDNKGEPGNMIGDLVYANLANAESGQTTNGYDFLSNGFKVKNVYGDGNVNGQTFIYMAFAENPFVTSTGVPTTAR